MRDHVKAIEEHVGKGLVHYVLANDNITDTTIPRAEQSRPVELDTSLNNGIRLVTSDVVSETNRYHHDSAKLAQAVMRIFYDRDQVLLPEIEEEAGELVSARDG